jgi:hypothetical protein
VHGIKRDVPRARHGWLRTVSSSTCPDLPRRGHQRKYGNEGHENPLGAHHLTRLLQFLAIIIGHSGR